MSAPATRWGIVSAGLISHDFCTALACLPQSEHRLVAVAARNIRDAEAFKKLHNVETVYEGYEAIAKDEDIDVVYIGAINKMHLSVGKLMLEAGKNVLCEKPLCMDLKETEELVQLARRKKVFFMEAVWSRCLPAYAALRKELADGTVGQVLQVIVTFGQNFGNIFGNSRDKYFREGGGTVMDLGIYCIQLGSLVFGGEKPLKIIAGGHLGDGGVDESSSTTLIYKEGRTATMITHSKVVLPCEALIVGTEGSLKLPFPMWTATALETPAGVQHFPLPEGAKHKMNFWNSENLAHEASHVRECLLAGKTESPLMPLDETLLLAEIMENIRRQIGSFQDTSN